jgi:Pentapeptide repeats (8 copies)
MANEEQLELIKRGVDAWNKWREEHADTRPDLTNANLTEADLTGANFIRANLSRANLSRANLTGARLVETNLDNANLNGCRIYGISAWNLKGVPRDQLDLIITRHDEPTVSVDNLEVAQFIYLLLHNEKIRGIIDTITSKVVLILGRFTPERKAILNALREALKARNYSPVIFDFQKPASRNLTETVSTLAHMARFVIADITDPKSIPQELQRIVPDLPSVPVQPLLDSSFKEYAMFGDFFDYPTVLTPHRYDRIEELVASLDEKVIAPAVNRAKEIEEKRKALEREIIK